MSGGSEQRESPHDKKCPDCGLWYRDQGASFAMHRSSCDGDETTEDTDDESSTSTASQTGTDPTTGSADGADGSSSSDSQEELPCGHESFDPDGAPSPPYEVSCDSCGRSWVVRD